MKNMRMSTVLALALAAALDALVLSPATAQMSGSETFEQYSALTASYRVVIRIGPKVAMAMSTMTATDQGRAVNRHLEVHVFNKTTGTEVKVVVPKVTISDLKMGASRGLTNITACRTSRHREREPHFGDNLYLADGTYSISVAIGQQTAVFKNIVLKPA